MALQSCVCLVSMVLMLTVQFQYCVVGGLNIQAIRLNGSQYPNEGRVEVLVNGTWSTVCKDGWGNHDANAACLQLRYPDGGRKMEDNDARDRKIDEGKLPFLLEKFECDDEDNDETMILILSNCDRDSKEIGSCDKAAKVVCEGNRSTTVLPSPRPDTTVMLNTNASLTGADSITEAPTNLGPTSNSRKQSQKFPVAVVAAVCSVLCLLLLLAVLLFFICRRRARSQEDNTASKLGKDTDQVGMGELAMGKAQEDNSENTYNTIQDPAVIPTAPPSEHDANYSTIPDLQSPPTGGRVDERAPALPPNQTDVYYSTVRDNGTASATDKTGTPVTVKTTQEPEYAVVKKPSKRKENKSEESDKGTGALGPEYAVVNKVPKTGGKGENQYGTVDNVIYEPY